MSPRREYDRTLLACYLGFVTQAICANFAPLLYVTFSKTYGIGLTHLALISTTFFSLQLVTDLLCAKVVDRVGYRPCVIAAELLSGLGLLGLAVMPDLAPSPLFGILTCVAVYAVGSGLTEVLASPIIEACPFDNKDMVMSTLHSFYCWGSVAVIVVSTAFFACLGVESWRVLAAALALVPLANVYNFATCPIDSLVEDGEGMGIRQLLGNRAFWLFIVLMVCAGASEVSMAQWASAFAESALGVSKTVGDLAGPCGFALLMGVPSPLWRVWGEGRPDRVHGGFRRPVPCLLPVGGAVRHPASWLGWLRPLRLLGRHHVAGLHQPLVEGHASGRDGPVRPASLAGDLGGAVGPSVVGSVSQHFGNNLQRGVLAGIGFPILLVACVLVVRRHAQEASPAPLGPS